MAIAIINSINVKPAGWVFRLFFKLILINLRMLRILWWYRSVSQDIKSNIGYYEKSLTTGRDLNKLVMGKIMMQIE
jgi:hypothetical protein